MKVEVRALKALDDFMAVAPEVTRQAASLSMNSVIPKKGVPQYKRAIRSQVSFPAGYLEEADKFGVTRFATPSHLEVAVTARQRPTSLARFATGGSVGTEGLTVRVKAGRTRVLKRAFLVRLRAGTSLEGGNVGVAVRIPGGAIRNKRDTSKMVRLAKDVFLLYAPSVDQVFRQVAETETPAVLNQIEAEFYRQFGRLS